MDQNELRRAVAAGFEASGETGLASRAADPQSTMLGPLHALPGGAVAVMFQAFPHPGASFYAGLAGGQVFYLTGAPEAFASMLRASGLQVADEQTAAEVARAYVETTRSMSTFSRVLDSVNDIKWDPRPERQPSPELLDQLHRSVRPPAATAVGPGLYEVSVFVLQGADAERRVLTVTADGAVTERTEDVVSGLPVPVSF